MLCTLCATAPTICRAAGCRSTAAIMWTVVVLPAEPVTPMISGFRIRSTTRAQKEQ